MTTAAKPAHATQVQYGDAATPEKFLTLLEAESIEPPESTVEMLDATSEDSTSDEVVPDNLVKNSEMSMRCLYSGDVTQLAVWGKLGAAICNWQLCLPNFGVRTKTFTVVAATNVLTATAHGLTTGQPVRVSSTTTLPAGLSAGVTYYAHYLSADTLTLHTTNAGAVADTGVVDITDTGTGTHSLQIGRRCSFAGSIASEKFDVPRGGLIAAPFKLKSSGAITTT